MSTDLLMECDLLSPYLSSSASILLTKTSALDHNSIVAESAEYFKLSHLEQNLPFTSLESCFPEIQRSLEFMKLIGLVVPKHVYGTKIFLKRLSYQLAEGSRKRELKQYISIYFALAAPCITALNAGSMKFDPAFSVYSRSCLEFVTFASYCLRRTNIRSSQAQEWLPLQPLIQSA